MRAWFGFLPRINGGFSETDIMKAIGIYLAKKEKSESKLHHLSKVLDDPDLIKQYIKEVEDASTKDETAKAIWDEGRFT